MGGRHPVRNGDSRTDPLFRRSGDVVCRTADGEIAFLANHMPYIGALDTGWSVSSAGWDSQTHSESMWVAVLGGFVEVNDNQVIMLADVAELASEVDLEQARRDVTFSGD